MRIASQRGCLAFLLLATYAFALPSLVDAADQPAGAHMDCSILGGSEELVLGFPAIVQLEVTGPAVMPDLHLFGRSGTGIVAEFGNPGLPESISLGGDRWEGDLWTTDRDGHPIPMPIKKIRLRAGETAVFSVDVDTLSDRGSHLRLRDLEPLEYDISLIVKGLSCTIPGVELVRPDPREAQLLDDLRRRLRKGYHWETWETATSIGFPLPDDWESWVRPSVRKQVLLYRLAEHLGTISHAGYPEGIEDLEGLLKGMPKDLRGEALSLVVLNSTPGSQLRRQAEERLRSGDDDLERYAWRLPALATVPDKK